MGNTPKPQEQDKPQVQKQVSSTSSEMSDLPVDPTPKRLETQKPVHLLQKASSITSASSEQPADDIVSPLSIEELLKLQEDVEVVFFYNRHKIETSTSMFEICK